MSQTHSRTVQIGDWSFELKSVRALKVDEYGKPYTAIANCNVDGNTMYIDGLLTKEGDEFNKQDFVSFYKFCQQVGIENCSYHRFQDGESVNKTVKVFPDKKGKYDNSPVAENDVDLAKDESKENSPTMQLVK